MSNKDKQAIDLSRLNQVQLHVTQHAGTEPPFSGQLLHNRKDGVYECLCCGTSLFLSETKFDAGCGWPSFFQPIDESLIKFIEDFSHGMHRIEVRCGNCNAHLGHVFPDGPQPTRQRYCINSASLSFTDDQTGEKTLG